MNENSSTTMRFQLITLSLLAIVITLQIAVLLAQSKENEIIGVRSSSGRIVFRREEIFVTQNNLSPYEFLITDGDGYRMQRLGNFTGSPSWSPDGQYLALGCSDPSKICILDTLLIPDGRSYPFDLGDVGQEIIAEITLPQPCLNLDLENWGLNSISWSPTGKELVIVCHNENDVHAEVCIISLDGDFRCWEHPASTGVIRASWSPLDVNQLAISVHNGIYIVDPYGNDRRFVANGWNAEWSSDGKLLAFFAYNDQYDWAGIATTNSDGTDLQWVYRPWDLPIFSTNPWGVIQFNCYVHSDGCKLTWSPDNRYLAFSGNVYGEGTHIFRINIASGEIIVLSNTQSFYRHYSEPDWGP